MKQSEKKVGLSFNFLNTATSNSHDQGKDYQPLTSLEDEYKDMATFYKGALQDAALFVLLYNSITSNGDFNVIEKLVKDYLKKYNKNKEYKKILNQVMQ